METPRCLAMSCATLIVEDNGKSQTSLLPRFQCILRMLLIGRSSGTLGVHTFTKLNREKNKMAYCTNSPRSLRTRSTKTKRKLQFRLAISVFYPLQRTFSNNFLVCLLRIINATDTIAAFPPMSNQSCAICLVALQYHDLA